MQKGKSLACTDVYFPPVKVKAQPWHHSEKPSHTCFSFPLAISGNENWNCCYRFGAQKALYTFSFFLKASLGLYECLRLKKMKPENFWKEEKKRKKLALGYFLFIYFLLPIQLGSSSCLSFFSNHCFCTRSSAACWSSPFLGFNVETTEFNRMQSVLQQAIDLPVEINSFPALSPPSCPSAFCSLPLQSLAVLKQRCFCSQMQFLFFASPSTQGLLRHQKSPAPSEDAGSNCHAPNPLGYPWSCLTLCIHYLASL